MILNQITHLNRKRLIVPFTLVAVAAALRVWPLQALGFMPAWLTFYPAVIIISIYGGLWFGLISTILICLIVSFGWSLIVDQPFNRKALEVQKKQAQQANLTKSSFFANMSHQLRSPQNAVPGYSHLMQRDSTLQVANIEYLQIINRIGEHLLTQINNVLEISRIEAKRVTLDLVNFNIHKLMQDIRNNRWEMILFYGPES